MAVYADDYPGVERQCASPVSFVDDELPVSWAEHPTRRRNPLFVRPKAYDSSDDDDSTIPSGDAIDLHPTYPRKSRPTLWDTTAWALVPVAGRGDSCFVERWTNEQHLRRAYPFWSPENSGVWKFITRMKLELDGTEDHPHHHSLYSLDTDADGFPNTHTGNELVQLCKESFPQLVGLSICMCIPELAIPHIPPFVYEIVAVSPKLKYLGVEDTQCTFVEPDGPGSFLYLASIALNGTRSPSDVRGSTVLDTLVISKKSIVTSEEYHEYRIDLELDARLQSAPTLSPFTLKPSGTTKNVDSLNEEAYKLARLMYGDFPSLRRAYVSLNRGELNFRVDTQGEFRDLSAGEVYLLWP
ncbi:hypothetical protein ONZ51_g11624 [Trametes cubensis]|uniref:Uncharacterized protein n=1 Tax=Trametes cubensis TaxID=1111947 RepID=A0AAD7X5A8_9APHY|nr:hypothetical protein ONZ51_g11624 [Trametes cubensis]